VTTIDRAIDLRLVSLVRHGYRGPVFIGTAADRANSDAVEVRLEAPVDSDLVRNRIDLGKKLAAVLENEARAHGPWGVAAA
jgi:hypothetical protein